ncbi:MAG: metallophosphoesterase [Elainellaceae cyanobacterium]
MSLSFRFAIASDPHIALPNTVPNPNPRFHRTELSIPVFEAVRDHLAQLDIDFLLMPGDLTQDGEPENHQWLSAQLATLPYPVYVVPGNHDLPVQIGSDRAIAAGEFPSYYAKSGFGTQTQHLPSQAKSCQDTLPPLYYTCNVIPGVRIIGLNSVFYDQAGQQTYAGRIDDAQLQWLRQVLQQSRQATLEKALLKTPKSQSAYRPEYSPEYIMVMVHHNVIEHLPGQSRSSLGKRYMLENASDLLAILKEFDVGLIFTGHLHVQDIAQIPVSQISSPSHPQGSVEDESDRPHPLTHITEITTGSLVSYPHPYRILQGWQDESGQHLKIETRHIQSVGECENLQHQSRERIAERSHPLMMRLLTDPPLRLAEAEAETLVPHLRYFWADICGGDAQFDFPYLPPAVQRYFARFSASPLIDNKVKLTVGSSIPQ